MHSLALVYLSLVCAAVIDALPLMGSQAGSGQSRQNRLWTRGDPSSSASPPPSSTIPPTTSASSTPTSNGDQKYVVAHHMVGNTFPYTIDNWKSDISLAYANGIDGFALNIGSDDWQKDRVNDAYEAARQSGTDFKLFISFDMSVLPCASPDNAAALRSYITQYATHPNQFIYKGRIFASTFAGQTCTFGQSSVAEGWSSQFTRHPDLTDQNAVFFVPSFFVDPNSFNTFNDVMDGALNWNSAWPITLTADSSILSGLLSTISNAVSPLLRGTDTDTQYMNGLNTMSNNGEKAYVPTVSPWFYTHYGADTFNKNWIYYADQHLYPTRWESLIASRDKFDVVEVVTWNDYGESHYIGPIEGAQPNSQAWVDGLDHTAWLNMTNYYAQAFKTGSFPAITEDKIYMWSRTHPKNANAPDAVGKPDNFQMTEDAVWAVVMAISPGQVTLQTSDMNSQTANVVAGVNKLSIPISAGDTMCAKLVRDGQTVVELKPDGFSFNGSPPSYNFNAFVASS